MIFKLVDGGIIDIDSDSQYYSGNCDTCDYGAEYVDYFRFTLTKKVINIEARDTFERVLSEGLMMRLMLNNVDLIREFTEEEFCDWLENELLKEDRGIDYNVVNRT